MIKLSKERLADAPQACFIQRLRWKKKKDRPHPRNRAKTDFKARLPIDAAALWILVHPAFDLSEGFACIGLIAGQKERFRQPRQVLMTIELVNHLRIGGHRARKIVFS